MGEKSPARASSIVAMLALAAFIAALPVAALAHAHEPVTLGEWMRTIFVTPDREMDRGQKALAATATPPPPVALQSSSEQQTPPKQQVVRDRLPDAWVRRDRVRGRRRRRVRPA
jgi:hypothetical protein